jgi:hypothetical protein
MIPHNDVFLTNWETRKVTEVFRISNIVTRLAIGLLDEEFTSSASYRQGVMLGLELGDKLGL